MTIGYKGKCRLCVCGARASARAFFYFFFLPTNVMTFNTSNLNQTVPLKVAWRAIIYQTADTLANGSCRFGKQGPQYIC